MNKNQPEELYLKGIIQKDESETVEFKKSTQLKDEIGEVISAFANSKGGVVIIGIDGSKIIGVEIGKNTIEDIANYIKQHTDPQVFPQIRIENIENKQLVLIDIKESQEKPVLFKGRAYKRVGKSTHKATAGEIRRLVSESKKVYWDEQVCEGASIDDVDEVKVKWFLRKAKVERNFDVDPEMPINETLKRLGLIKYGRLTNAAILLFGRKPQKFFLLAEIRCARFKGTEPLEFIDMKIFGGNIIDQRDNALEFVKEHIKLHAKIVGVERVETWEYPIEAVREAITNAVCHRDYEITSNVQVRIFDDRIEVWGCGPLPEPLTLDSLKKRHDSVLRNPLVSKSLFLIKYIEQWGTGTNRIIKECLKHRLPEPLFELISGSIVVTFRKYTITDELIESLGERQKKIIDFLREHKKGTSKDFQKLCLEVTRETLRKDLKCMVDKKIITKTGVKKGVYYNLR